MFLYNDLAVLILKVGLFLLVCLFVLILIFAMIDRYQRRRARLIQTRLRNTYLAIRDEREQAELAKKRDDQIFREVDEFYGSTG